MQPKCRSDWAPDLTGPFLVPPARPLIGTQRLHRDAGHVMRRRFESWRGRQRVLVGGTARTAGKYPNGALPILCPSSRSTLDR